MKPDNPARPSDNLWSFTYKQGIAPKTGIVRARDEATAYVVASRWAQLNGVRAPSKVMPMVLADESILSADVTTRLQPEPLPNAVAATTR